MSRNSQELNNQPCKPISGLFKDKKKKASSAVVTDQYKHQNLKHGVFFL